jgi:hypothetical protein
MAGHGRSTIDYGFAARKCHLKIMVLSVRDPSRATTRCCICNFSRAHNPTGRNAPLSETCLHCLRSGLHCNVSHMPAISNTMRNIPSCRLDTQPKEHAGPFACVLGGLAIAAALHGFWASEDCSLAWNVESVLALCKSNGSRVVVPAHGK